MRASGIAILTPLCLSQNLSFSPHAYACRHRLPLQDTPLDYTGQTMRTWFSKLFFSCEFRAVWFLFLSVLRSLANQVPIFWFPNIFYLVGALLFLLTTRRCSFQQTSLMGFGQVFQVRWGVFVKLQAHITFTIQTCRFSHMNIVFLYLWATCSPGQEHWSQTVQN